MKFKNKTAQIGYAVLCVVLSGLLIFGIFYVVALGNKMDKEEFDSGFDESQPVWNESLSDSSDEQSSSESRYISEPSDTVDSSVKRNGVSVKSIDKSATSFDISVPYGKVEIKPTDKDEPYFTTEYDDKLSHRVQLNTNGEWEIEFEHREKPFNFNISEKTKFKACFYLPKETIKKLSVDCDAASLYINDIKTDLLDIDIDAGTGTIKGCTVGKLDADVDAGNLEFYANSDIKVIDIDIDAGNAKLLLPKDISGFQIAYNVDMGNFSDKSSFKAYSSNEGFISKKGVYVYGNEGCNISISVDVGNFTLGDYE